MGMPGLWTVNTGWSSRVQEGTDQMQSVQIGEDAVTETLVNSCSLYE